ncbi:MAG: hypothetical protein KDA24_03610 [Deltaproteobacteria bacterium]|nr:hypothetical protein [Deltaproteobacteria bacterium]
MSDSPPNNVFATAFSVLVILGIGIWMWIGAPLSAALDRGIIPGLEDEPFYPAPSALADAVLDVARQTLQAEAAALLTERAPKQDLAADSDELAGEASEQPVVDPTAEATPEPPAPPPRTAADDLEKYPQLAELGVDPWVLSLYLPTPREDLRGPHVGEVTDANVREVARSLIAGLDRKHLTAALLTEGTWKVDQILPGRRELTDGSGPRGVAIDPGLDGIELVHPDAGAAWRYLPSWSAERAIKRRRILSSARKAARADGWPKARTNQARVYLFRSRAWVEAADGGAPARPTARGNTVGREPTIEEVRWSIQQAGAYLVRETDSRGKFTYRYLAHEDENGPSYNMLRHAGTTYSMFQVYRFTGEEEVFEAATRANRYFRKRMREDDKHPGEWFILDGGGRRKRAKLGGAGLGLLALVEMEKARPGSSDYEAMFGLARHIERMQQPDGSFLSFYNWDGEERSTRKSTFYPGEATLALVRLHQLTGDERWLDVAERAADYYVDRRWVSLGLRIYVPPDAWGIQALEELDRARPNARRQNYAFAVADSIARHKLMDPETTPADMVGGDVSGMGSLPLAANSGSYGEALTAGARLEVRLRPGETKHQDDALTNLTMQLRNQFVEANDWFLPNPARARGGFRFRPNDHEIGNDVVQHNISGLVGVLQFMDPTAPNIGLVVGPEERHPSLVAAMEAAR